jgi:hypothetical protein
VVGSYEKVIVAVLACHGEGRCVGESDSGWRCKGAQAAVEGRVERVEVVVDVTEACGGLSAGGEYDWTDGREGDGCRS